MSSLDILLPEVKLSKKKKKKKKKKAGPNAANNLDMPPSDVKMSKKKKGEAGAQPQTVAALSSEAKLDLPLDGLQKAGKKRTASAANWTTPCTRSRRPPGRRRRANSSSRARRRWGKNKVGRKT
jgi:hypothetical protein